MIATDLYSLLEAMTVLIGIMGIVTIAGIVIIVAMREDSGRSVIPWGVRHKVEKARAEAEIEQHRLELLATETKRLAVEAKRNKVMSALQNSEDVDLAALLQKQLPRANMTDWE